MGCIIFRYDVSMLSVFRMINDKTFIEKKKFFLFAHYFKSLRNEKIRRYEMKQKYRYGYSALTLRGEFQTKPECMNNPKTL
jgi:hypothetical protein